MSDSMTNVVYECRSIQPFHLLFANALNSCFCSVLFLVLVIYWLVSGIPLRALFYESGRNRENESTNHKKIEHYMKFTMLMQTVGNLLSGAGYIMNATGVDCAVTGAFIFTGELLTLCFVVILLLLLVLAERWRNNSSRALKVPTNIDAGMVVVSIISVLISVGGMIAIIVWEGAETSAVWCWLKLDPDGQLKWAWVWLWRIPCLVLLVVMLLLLASRIFFYCMERDSNARQSWIFGNFLVYLLYVASYLGIWIPEIILGMVFGTGSTALHWATASLVPLTGTVNFLLGASIVFFNYASYSNKRWGQAQAVHSENY